jgi:hypothetical protein
MTTLESSARIALDVLEEIGAYKEPGGLAAIESLRRALAETVTPAAWLMDSGDDASWIEIGPKQPAPEAGFVAVPLYR